ncbi:hypothetical protein J4Q44_G00017160 [Coregonus suidteri]|uniref:Uncharacterized protein n=1 Tax=Coregonus suidteri TaxID=861788 RepID=A0AAN8MIH4_9TELE
MLRQFVIDTLMPPLILKQWASTPPINIDTLTVLRNLYQHWTMTQATTGHRSHHTIRDANTPRFGAMFGEPLTRLTELGSGERAGSSGPVWRRKVGEVNGSAERRKEAEIWLFWASLFLSVHTLGQSFCVLGGISLTSFRCPLQILDVSEFDGQEKQKRVEWEWEVKPASTSHCSTKKRGSTKKGRHSPTY